MAAVLYAVVAQPAWASRCAEHWSYGSEPAGAAGDVLRSVGADAQEPPDTLQVLDTLLGERCPVGVVDMRRDGDLELSRTPISADAMLLGKRCEAEIVAGVAQI